MALNLELLSFKYVMGARSLSVLAFILCLFTQNRELLCVWYKVFTWRVNTNIWRFAKCVSFVFGIRCSLGESIPIESDKTTSIYNVSTRVLSKK